MSLALILAPNWSDEALEQFRREWAYAAATRTGVTWPRLKVIANPDDAPESFRRYFRIRFPAKTGEAGEYYVSRKGRNAWDSLFSIRGVLDVGMWNEGTFDRTPFSEVDFEVVEVVEHIRTEICPLLLESIPTSEDVATRVAENGEMS